MKLRALGLCLLGLGWLVPGCAPREDRAGLVRRAVGPATRSGWARLPLDGPAQAARASLWLGDEQGRPVAARWAPENAGPARPLACSGLLLGRDGAGRPSAEFSLQAPYGGPGPRQELQLQFQCEAGAPWAARVQVQRRLPGSGYLTLEQEPPPVLYDFGPSGSRLGFSIPWEAPGYRIVLEPVQGSPRLLGLTVQASPAPAAWADSLRLEPRREPLPGGPGQRWRLTLPAPERIAGLLLELEPPVAPCAPRLRLPGPAGGTPGPLLAGPGLVWNLPALDSAATQVSLDPVVTGELELELPEGVRLAGVKLLVRREVLLFPAEAGRTYFLHAGGRVKTAPGSLEALPGAGGRFPEAALALGPAEPDPQGLALLRTAEDRSRAWLPWAAGLAVLVLGLAALRLLKT